MATSKIQIVPTETASITDSVAGFNGYVTFKKCGKVCTVLFNIDNASIPITAYQNLHIGNIPAGFVPNSVIQTMSMIASTGGTLKNARIELDTAGRVRILDQSGGAFSIRTVQGTMAYLL